MPRARTPLMAFLQGLYRDYADAEQAGCSVQEVQAERHEQQRKAILTRRELIKAGGAIAAAGALAGPQVLGRALQAAAATTPRIAVIGAGIAGLSAALQLQDGNPPKVPAYASTIYEASGYIGGRMHSDTTSWANGQVSEHCGELIDTNHTTLLNLATRFNLATTDLLAAQPSGSTDLYFFFNKYYPYSQAVTDFGPVYNALQSDIKSAPFPTLYNSFTAAGQALDNMSNYQWIESRVPGGHTSPMGQLIDVSYATEFGLDSTAQSSLNIVYLLGFQPKPVKFSIFGTSDERFHITGGNQQLPVAIANLLTTRSPQCTINLNTKMTAVALNADGTYTLTFAQGNTTFTQVFDRVILSLPFSVLRGLNFGAAGFDPLKTNAINNLGYGTNSKLHLQFNSRLWNQSGQPWGIANNGTTYVDTGYQTSWDVTRGQSGSTGLQVQYTGGTIGTSFTRDDSASLASYAKNFLSQLEPVYPGITPLWNGRVTLDTPWRNPNLLGSYACYKVGQYTTITGSEKLRSGKCHFAGEHCSLNFQGFMEGGAEEGKRAAQEIQSDYASNIFP
ncbi:FAD-dependent oxidoreductase [bacterium]|nr:MAG: FAD-dependent oxidoreductase [bacterium]